MKRIFVFIYGVANYLISLGIQAYFIAFVGGILVPKTIDNGIQVSLGEDYAQYKRQVPKLVPGLKKQSTDKSLTTSRF